MTNAATRFQRWILPGLAFKAAVIGGGYATGRELAEYFIPSGPQGGMLAILVAMACWSIVCALTFALAHATRSFDYRSFFEMLLGPFAFLFELAYGIFMVLILAVFGAAAGEIFSAVLGWPTLAGTLLLMVTIGFFVTFGNDTVEALFKWVSVLLYGTYAAFLVLVLARFGDAAFTTLSVPQPTTGLLQGGLTYAGYNIVGAVIILPLARHFLSRRDAVVAGVLSGPLAMLPGLFFFLCMLAWYPQIGTVALPSDFILRQLNLPVFHVLFQLMIFSALLESGTAVVHACNERIARTFARREGAGLGKPARSMIAGVLLVGSIFIADRVGLVALIAQGYRGLAYMFLCLYILPLLTVGSWRLLQRAARRTAPTAHS
ncbi:TPA: YkvI family membrane protein [Stenotrophomonas maltophilia]